MTGKKLFAEVARDEGGPGTPAPAAVLSASASSTIAADASTACSVESEIEAEPQQIGLPADGRRARVPFNERSQLEKDLALARTLQEQEQAFYFLEARPPIRSRRAGWRGNRNPAMDPGEEDEEDEEDEWEEVSEGDLVEGVGEGAHEDAGEEEEEDGDEALARRLQEQEDLETRARLMALAGMGPAEWSEYEGGEEGVREREGEEEGEGEEGEEREEEFEDEEYDEEEEEEDGEEMSYEELTALGEAVGTESRGVAPGVVSRLKRSKFEGAELEGGGGEERDLEQCVICRDEFEVGEDVLELPCVHRYHPPCIATWLKTHKVCCVCNKEVSHDAATGK